MMRASLVKNDENDTEKLIVDVPIIYGAHTSDVTNNTAKIHYGVLAKLPIENCTLELYSDWKSENLVKTISLPKEDSFHSFTLDDLEPQTNYFCKIEVTQEGDPDYNNNKSVNATRVKFQTPKD